MTRLDLQALPAQIQQPSYDRSVLKPRIAHIGFGGVVACVGTPGFARKFDKVFGKNRVRACVWPVSCSVLSAAGRYGCP